MTSTASLLKAVTTTGTGPWVPVVSSTVKSFQVALAGTGALTATVVIEVSNNGVNEVTAPLHTFTLSGNTLVSEGVASLDSWAYYRARLTALTGTGATVSATMGV